MELPDKSRPTTRPRKEAVIPKGAAVESVRPARRRFLDYIFAESPKALLGVVIANTLVPTLKSGVEEAAKGFLHGMLWPNGAAPNNFMRQPMARGGGVIINGMDYNAISNPNIQAAAASGHMTGPYKDLTVPTQQFAETLLAALYADINQYQVVTVADLYEAAGLTPEASHSSFGWYSLDGARIVQDSQGYKLMLPRPVRV